MAAVDIGIRHQNNFVIAELRDVKVVAVALRKAAAEAVDHGLDLRVRKYLVNRSLFDIQNLTAYREYRLIHAVSRGLCGAACGISLDNENLTLRGIPGLAVREFSVRIEREARLCQEVGSRLLLGPPYLCRLFGAGNDGANRLQVAVKIARELIARNRGDRLRRIRAREFGLGLSLENRIRVLDGDNRCHAVSRVRAGEVRVLLL